MKFGKSFTLLFIAAPLFLAAAGCGNGQPVAERPQPVEISQTAKQQLADFIALVEKSPAKAKAEGPILMESMDAYAVDYGEEFAAVRTAVSGLNDVLQNGADAATIQAKLEDLKTVVSFLP
ncbi:MAG: hypothetical protein R3C49_21005 [Planctomycetaceae bacterium]